MFKFYMSHATNDMRIFTRLAGKRAEAMQLLKEI
jgi:hypothetical protein